MHMDKFQQSKLKMAKRTAPKCLAGADKLMKVSASVNSGMEITVSSYFMQSTSGPKDISPRQEKHSKPVPQNHPIPVRGPLAQGSLTATDHQPTRTRLTHCFYDQDCVTLAKALLGQVVVRDVDGVRVSGSIVETEGYLGGPDTASHSHGGKRTTRNEPMYMTPGTAYVYSIYGIYYCFNISCRGEGACVLIRALEPLEGTHKMEIGRNARRKSATPLKHHQLCNGPSKLCQALYLTKESCNKLNLNESEVFWLEEGSPIPDSQIVISKRVGIDSYGEESANKPLRFYIQDSKFVSVRDKEAEGRMKGM